MDMNLNESNDRKQMIKKEVSTILENWRALYSKEHTSIVEEIKKCINKKSFVSGDEYGMACFCKDEGTEIFRGIFNEYKRPFDREEFIRIQKAVFMNKIENDCRKLSWYLSGIVTCENVYALISDVQKQIEQIGELLEETLSLAWEEHRIVFEVISFTEMQKHIEVKAFSYEPSGSDLGRMACKAIGVKTYEYDLSCAVHALDEFLTEMSAEADRIATKAVDSAITRKIVEPIKFVLTVM